MKRKEIRSKEDMIFDWINFTVLTLTALVVIYPLYFVLIASFSNPDLVNQGNVWLIPKGITLEGYSKIFQDPMIWIGYRNSLMYMVMGTFINIAVTLTAGYALSRKELPGRNFIMMMFVFTLFFNGGLIPTYLIVKNLGLLNTIWAMIIPKALNVFNLIICKSYFEGNIPNSLYECAKIEGCSETYFFFRIVLPLSKPLIAIMILFYAIAHWNAFFEALIYLRDETLYPLQMVLRNILVQNQLNSGMMGDMDSYLAKQRLAELIKYGVIIVASIPVLILYPFVQKYFVKGAMIGSVKG